MTKENETKNIIETLKTMLQQWESEKQKRKESNSFFKLENKIAFIDNLNQKALNLVLKYNNKNGFIAIYETDIFKIYLKKFYESNGVFWAKDEKEKLVYLLKDGKKENFLACQDFKKYAFEKIEENKQKERERKQKLENKKTGLQLNKLDAETLQAIILQAKKQLATTKKSK